jgi:hypothetical protein
VRRKACGQAYAVRRTAGACRSTPTLDSMNSTSVADQSEALRRYRGMEKGAGLALLVLSIIAVSLAWLYRPGTLFIVGSIGAGLLGSWSWRAALQDQQSLAFGTAFAAVIGSLLTAVTEFHQTTPVLICMGVSLMGAGLYAGVFCGKIYRGSGGHAL